MKIYDNNGQDIPFSPLYFKKWILNQIKNTFKIALAFSNASFLLGLRTRYIDSHIEHLVVLPQIFQSILPDVLFLKF